MDDLEMYAKGSQLYIPTAQEHKPLKGCFLPKEWKWRNETTLELGIWTMNSKDVISGWDLEFGALSLDS